MASIHLLGIRHHGPGSARSVVRALEEIDPEVILIEGPPDADAILPLLSSPDLQLPIALLVYAPDDPRRAAYYPFAEFSPEWQAIRFGQSHERPVRFMDLPQAYQLAEESEESDESPESVDSSDSPDSQDSAPSPSLHSDPLGAVAEAAGWEDGEEWWEQMVELQHGGVDAFAVVAELMTALRNGSAGESSNGSTGVPPDSPEQAESGGTPVLRDTDSGGAPVLRDDVWESRREAWMRQTIRAARRDGFERIAVICGAWHVPALAGLDADKKKSGLPNAAQDSETLKGLPKMKATATAVPWTYGRLTYWSGYGAGIASPAWYEHLWSCSVRDAGEAPVTPSTIWMARAAGLFREEDLPVSTASVIEAVRLAEALAAVRGRPNPGLRELMEAARSVYCFGSDVPMQLIREKLVVGERLGRVPDDTPMLPIQQDLRREQKRLRLPAEASHKDFDLDLRKPNDLDRSRLLHRLNVLGIEWGTLQDSPEIGGRRAAPKGTFHEIWRVQWRPEFEILLIEANVWGATVLAAATGRTIEELRDMDDLPALTEIVERTLLADLPDAIGPVMDRLNNVAALTSDIPHLMEALPPLANVLRYGNVRKTDTEMVAHVVDGLIARICIGLSPACSALNDEAARQMFGLINAVQQSVALLGDDDYKAAWNAALGKLAEQAAVHGLVAGRAARLLFDLGAMPEDEAALRMSQALSTAVDPTQAAAWLEGFLSGSGLLLLHNDALWRILDAWVAELAEDAFLQLLPLVRRTFSSFPAPERRQMGERSRHAGRATSSVIMDDDVDWDRAALVLPMVGRLLGLETGI